MSRTDKDTPQWVLLNRPEMWAGERHATWVTITDEHGRRRLVAHRPDLCDLHMPATANGWPHCEHILRETPRSPRWYYGGLGKKARHLRWNAPERTATREALTELVKQHRGGAELDDSRVPVQQHRHATWGGGWWD